MFRLPPCRARRLRGAAVRLAGSAVWLGAALPEAGAEPPVAPPMRAAAAAVDSVLAFRLSDQFGRVHEAAGYRGRPFIVVGAGRGGRADGTAWVQALRGLQCPGEALAAVPIVAVADRRHAGQTVHPRGVPRLLRRVVRSQFPDDRRQPVLLDWDGALARRLAFDPASCTIALVDGGGRTIARTQVAAVDTAAARELLRRAAAPPAAALTSGTP